jgi:NAD(P)-dependent dehydrogenase (short-subunit alcohol dehydrogenase family)
MSGKIWFITGCATGFGRSLAEAALRRGDNVAVTDRSGDAVADLGAAFPDTALALGLDVTKPDQVRAALDAAFDRFGRIDVLVNNAGYGLLAAIEEASDAQIRQMFEVNFFGMLDIIRTALPRLRAQGAGHIVNFSSVGGRVSMVEPGSFGTGFGPSAIMADQPLVDYQPVRDGMMAQIGDLKLGHPDDLAAAILEMVDSPEPPLRFVGGADAYAMIERNLLSQQAEMEQWRGLSSSANKAALQAG